ncbi:MAG: 4'-phosphopantetheinyl transferase superfamily protein [Desulfobacterales bacterium]|nr:4'-phosphopantetheinyl transferase superfamily protein [Desulfobacterales bacterium]
MMFELTLHPVILAVSAADQRLIRRAKVEALRRRAREAAALSAHHGGYLLGELEKDDAGVPRPSNGFYWSLSHKERMVAAVVSPRPVGIDLERLAPMNERMYDRIADASEWCLAPHKIERFFFRYWTAKEAVLKAVGKGLTGLDRCRVQAIPDDDHLSLLYEQTLWGVTHCWIGDDHLATVTSDRVLLQWHILD